MAHIPGTPREGMIISAMMGSAAKGLHVEGWPDYVYVVDEQRVTHTAYWDGAKRHGLPCRIEFRKGHHPRVLSLCQEASQVDEHGALHAWPDLSDTISLPEQRTFYCVYCLADRVPTKQGNCPGCGNPIKND